MILLSAMKKFSVEPDNINSSLSHALGCIESCLKPKQESHAVLMAEESLNLLMKHANFSQAD